MKTTLTSRWTVPFAIIISLVIILLDYLTGRYIRLSILFIFPVALSAWSNHKNLAYILAVSLPCTRLLFFIPWQEMEDFNTGLINAFIRMAALMVVAFLAGQARQVIALRREVKVLEGMLPICSSCKRIRNAKGEYELMEKFISDRSDVSFSHGFCPECFKKFYPEYSYPDESSQK